VKKEIDLRLLRVIHSVVTTGTVTQAAISLKQSPGNISYQLGKARDITGAHLFIRTRDGMKPDATALELSQRYEHFMENSTPQNNDSIHAHRNSLSINTFSLIEMMLAINVCGSEVEQTSLRYIFNAYISNPEERLNKLRSNAVDIDIGNKLPADAMITAVKLFTSGVSVLVGEQQYNKKEGFNLRELQASRHAIWSAVPDFYSESIDGAIQTSHFIQSRDIAVISGSMINMVSLCANSNYIMLIPDFFASMLEKAFQVKCLPLPDELDIHYDCYLHYASQLDREPEILESIQSSLAKMKEEGTWFQKTRAWL
jgi:DNA-binding transcriptional LysR family regulator